MRFSGFSIPSSIGFVFSVAFALLFSSNSLLSSMASSQTHDSRKLFVATNWKCSIESPSDADKLVESMNEKWSALDQSVKDSLELSVHPPYVFLDRVRKGL